MVHALINGKPVQLLLDTGSVVTLLGLDTWTRCKSDSDKLEQWSGPKLVGVDGSPLQVAGHTRIKITLAHVTLTHPVLVVDSLLSEGILGLDFLQDNECSVNLAKGKDAMYVGPQKVVVPLSSARTKVCECVNVIVARTMRIPERSELEISAVTQDPICDGGTYLLEGVEGGKSSALVARAVVSPINNTVVVRVLNPHKEVITLYQNTKIAVMQDVNPICVVTGDGGAREEAALLESEKCQMLWEIAQNCQANLSEVEKSDFYQFLLGFEDIFADNHTPLGRTSLMKHSINTGTVPPIRQAMRRTPPSKRQEIDQLLENMLQKDVIQPSCSPWASPIVLVQKKDGSTRFCVDYRKLNSVTRKDAYPLPRIDDTLDTLYGSRWFSTLDLASGYWQVELAKDQHKTAFCIPNGLYEFRVMPFGLCNAPATFQRLMDLMLTGLQWSSCLVYLDDIIIMGKNFNDHLQNINLIFQRIRDAGLKLQPPKCKFFQEEVTYLGHLVSQKGISVDPTKIDKVEHWPIPQNAKEVQQFLGFANYYRRFVQGFAELAKPLHRLTERNVSFNWTHECQESFNNLRQKLISPPVLAYPNFEKSFILDTDASNSGIGAVLSQLGDDGLEHVIAYGSRLLSKPERQYCITRCELLAVIVFTRHFRPYLLGRSFVLRTDHGSLQWLRNFKEPEGQIARWLEALQELDFEVVHRRGRLHSNADALSRMPCKQCGRSVTEYNVEGSEELVAATTICAQEDRTIKQLQLEDPVLGPIIKCMQQNTPQPAPQDLESRRLLQLWNQLLLKQDVLYCTLPSATSPGLCDKLVVPKVLCGEVLSELHEGSFGGHLGMEKTLGKVKERFYWPGHFSDVQKWCNTCAVCAMRKTPVPRPKAKLCNISVGSPMELVAMDILGPLPETAAGNSYILVVGDYFTKWMEAYPIPNQEATTIASKLVNEFICHFSVP